MSAVPAGELERTIRKNVADALAEDVGRGDLTATLLPESATAQATIVTREAMVLAGRPWVDEVYRQLDVAVGIDWQAADADPLHAGAALCRLEGPARSLLTGERTALNFLQTLSGTATVTRAYVDAIAGTGCTLLDTRKTLPGLRAAQKYAVRCGGGRNHRMGLYDAMLIKENHIAAAGGIAAALDEARRNAPGRPVEIEVESLAQLEEALDAGADWILLDNFSLDELRRAVGLARKRSAGTGPAVRLEASGGVDLTTAREIAATGVDFLSVGALTKHVRAVDLSLRFR